MKKKKTMEDRYKLFSSDRTVNVPKQKSVRAEKDRQKQHGYKTQQTPPTRRRLRKAFHYLGPVGTASGGGRGAGSPVTHPEE